MSRRTAQIDPASGAVTDGERQALELLVQRMAKYTSEGLHQTVADTLWSQIPVPTSGYSPAGTQVQIGQVLVAPRQVSGLEYLIAVVTSVPVGATGLLAIGPQAGGNGIVVPVPAGVTVISSIGQLMQANDFVTLTLAGAAGLASIWYMGEQRPTYGKL